MSSISGGISTLPLPVLPGPGEMAVWRPVLIFLVCRFRGCLLFLRVILSIVLFRTIVVCVSRSIPDVVPPGPGFWKLNTSVLNDPVYVALISDAWSSWRRSISRFPSLVK